MNRRAFGKVLVAGTASCLLPRFASASEQPAEEGINDTLRRIAAVLRKCPVVASVDECLTDFPEVRLTQWRWAHFRPDITNIVLPYVERVNDQLFSVMRKVRAIPNAGLDELLQEGLVEGSEEERMEQFHENHRMIIKDHTTEQQKQESDPARRAWERRLLRLPAWQVIDGRPFVVSLQGQWGVGYMLSLTDGVRLRAAEDPFFDAMAGHHERGTLAERLRWVMEERNRHFVRLVAHGRRRMVHLLAGYSHDLRDDIAVSNSESHSPISHLVVTVQEIVDMVKRWGTS